MLQKFGVDEENFGQFVSEVYNKCREQDLRPYYIAHNMKEMVDLCQSVPFSQITHHVRQKQSEETQLVKDVLALGDEKCFLQEAVNKQKALLADLGPFRELKIELELFLVWQALIFRMTMIQVTQQLRDVSSGFFTIH